MADKTTTTFPKVGTEAAVLGHVAKPERGRSIKKTGNIKGGTPEPDTAVARENVYERLGAKFAPTPRTSIPNAPEAALTQRNTVIVPSALGEGDFYLRRRYAQNS